MPGAASARTTEARLLTINLVLGGSFQLGRFGLEFAAKRFQRFDHLGIGNGARETKAAFRLLSHMLRIKRCHR